MYPVPNAQNRTYFPENGVKSTSPCFENFPRPGVPQNKEIHSAYWPGNPSNVLTHISEGYVDPKVNYNNVIKNSQDYRYNYCSQQKKSPILDNNYYIPKNCDTRNSPGVPSVQNYPAQTLTDRRISPVQNFIPPKPAPEYSNMYLEKPNERLVHDANYQKNNLDVRYSQYVPQSNYFPPKSINDPKSLICNVPKKPQYTILEQRLTNQNYNEINEYMYPKYGPVMQSKSSPTQRIPNQNYIPPQSRKPVQNFEQNWVVPREYRDNRYFSQVAQLDPGVAQGIIQHHNALKHYEIPKDRIFENVRYPYSNKKIYYPEANFQNNIRPVRPMAATYLPEIPRTDIYGMKNMEEPNKFVRKTTEYPTSCKIDNYRPDLQIGRENGYRPEEMYPPNMQMRSLHYPVPMHRHGGVQPENPPRNISPRSTFQENMSTVVIPSPNMQGYPQNDYYNQNYYNNMPVQYSEYQRNQNVPRLYPQTRLPYTENYAQIQEEFNQRFNRPGNYEYGGKIRPEDASRKDYPSVKESEISRLNLKEFFENWEDDEEVVNNLPDLIPSSNVIERNSSIDSTYDHSESSNDKASFESETASNEPSTNQPIYILEKQNISAEMLSKYQHLTPVDRLPDNIKGYYNETSAKPELRKNTPEQVLNLSVTKPPEGNSVPTDTGNLEENNNSLCPQDINESQVKEDSEKAAKKESEYKSVIVSNIQFDGEKETNNLHENEESANASNKSEDAPNLAEFALPFSSNSSDQTENINMLSEYVNSNTSLIGAEDKENCENEQSESSASADQNSNINSPENGKKSGCETVEKEHDGKLEPKDGNPYSPQDDFEKDVKEKDEELEVKNDDNVKIDDSLEAVKSPENTMDGIVEDKSPSSQNYNDVDDTESASEYSSDEKEDNFVEESSTGKGKDDIVTEKEDVEHKTVDDDCLLGLDTKDENVSLCEPLGVSTQTDTKKLNGNICLATSFETQEIKDIDKETPAVIDAETSPLNNDNDLLEKEKTEGNSDGRNSESSHDLKTEFVNKVELDGITSEPDFAANLKEDYPNRVLDKDEDKGGSINEDNASNTSMEVSQKIQNEEDHADSLGQSSLPNSEEMKENVTNTELDIHEEQRENAENKEMHLAEEETDKILAQIDSCINEAENNANSENENECKSAEESEEKLASENDVKSDEEGRSSEESKEDVPKEEELREDDLVQHEMEVNSILNDSKNIGNDEENHHFNDCIEETSLQSEIIIDHCCNRNNQIVENSCSEVVMHDFQEDKTETPVNTVENILDSEDNQLHGNHVELQESEKLEITTQQNCQNVECQESGKHQNCIDPPHQIKIMTDSAVQTTFDFPLDSLETTKLKRKRNKFKYADHDTPKIRKKENFRSRAENRRLKQKLLSEKRKRLKERKLKTLIARNMVKVKKEIIEIEDDEEDMGQFINPENPENEVQEENASEIRGESVTEKNLEQYSLGDKILLDKFLQESVEHTNQETEFNGDDLKAPQNKLNKEDGNNVTYLTDGLMVNIPSRKQSFMSDSNTEPSEASTLESLTDNIPLSFPSKKSSEIRRSVDDRAEPNFTLPDKLPEHNAKKRTAEKERRPVISIDEISKNVQEAMNFFSESENRRKSTSSIADDKDARSLVSKDSFEADTKEENGKNTNDNRSEDNSEKSSKADESVVINQETSTAIDDKSHDDQESSLIKEKEGEIIPEIKEEINNSTFSADTEILGRCLSENISLCKSSNSADTVDLSAELLKQITEEIPKNLVPIESSLEKTIRPNDLITMKSPDVSIITLESSSGDINSKEVGNQESSIFRATTIERSLEDINFTKVEADQNSDNTLTVEVSIDEAQTQKDSAIDAVAIERPLEEIAKPVEAETHRNANIELTSNSCSVIKFSSNGNKTVKSREELQLETDTTKFNPIKGISNKFDVIPESSETIISNSVCDELPALDFGKSLHDSPPAKELYYENEPSNVIEEYIIENGENYELLITSDQDVLEVSEISANAAIIENTVGDEESVSKIPDNQNAEIEISDDSFSSNELLIETGVDIFQEVVIDDAVREEEVDDNRTEIEDFPQESNNPIEIETSLNITRSSSIEEFSHLPVYFRMGQHDSEVKNNESITKTRKINLQDYRRRKLNQRRENQKSPENSNNSFSENTFFEIEYGKQHHNKIPRLILERTSSDKRLEKLDSLEKQHQLSKTEDKVIERIRDEHFSNSLNNTKSTPDVLENKVLTTRKNSLENHSPLLKISRKHVPTSAEKKLFERLSKGLTEKLEEITKIPPKKHKIATDAVEKSRTNEWNKQPKENVKEETRAIRIEEKGKESSTSTYYILPTKLYNQEKLNVKHPSKKEEHRHTGENAEKRTGTENKFYSKKEDKIRKTQIKEEFQEEKSGSGADCKKEKHNGLIKIAEAQNRVVEEGLKEKTKSKKTPQKDPKKISLLDEQSAEKTLFVDPLILKRTYSTEDCKSKNKKVKKNDDDDVSTPEAPLIHPIRRASEDLTKEKQEKKVHKETRRKSLEIRDKSPKNTKEVIKPKMEKTNKPETIAKPETDHTKENVYTKKHRKRKKRFRNLYTLSDSEEEVPFTKPRLEENSLKVKIPRDCFEKANQNLKLIGIAERFVDDEDSNVVPKVIIKKNGTTYVSTFMKHAQVPFWQPKVILQRYPSCEVLEIEKHKS